LRHLILNTAVVVFVGCMGFRFRVLDIACRDLIDIDLMTTV
jgi:hypothetical protein